MPNDSYRNSNGNKHNNKPCDEAEYVISVEESIIYPQLTRLITQGYRFTILQRNRKRLQTFALASDLICSNGKELLQRFDLLTPEFHSLDELEQFTHENMLGILGRHLRGQWPEDQ